MPSCARHANRHATSDWHVPISHFRAWHKEHPDAPSGSAARRATWHDTFGKFDLSVVYVPGKDNTVTDCLGRWALSAGKVWMDKSSHGHAEEAEGAKRNIEFEKAMEEGDTNCFVVMASKAELSQRRDPQVSVLMEENFQERLLAPMEYVESVLMGEGSNDCAASEHWNKHWNVVSAPSGDEWLEGSTEDKDKVFLNDKLFVPKNCVHALIDHQHNTQLMSPGRKKMQPDLEWRLEFPPEYYAMLNRYCNDCAVCRATKSANHSTAGNRVYIAIPEAPMRSIATDVFAMPAGKIEGEKYDCMVSAVDRHTGYIVAVPGKKSKKKDNKDHNGVGLQAKTVNRAMIRHWLTIFGVPAVVRSYRET